MTRAQAGDVLRGLVTLQGRTQTPAGDAAIERAALHGYLYCCALQLGITVHPGYNAPEMVGQVFNRLQAIADTPEKWPAS